MKNKRLHKLVLTALFAAMTTVATLILQIPIPGGGYVNPGDCIILLCAWVLGPAAGAAAGGLGAALADLLSGYALYAPGTLIVKALMGLCAGIFLCRRTARLSLRLLGGAVAEAVMVLGYFAYEAAILGVGPGAAAGIPGNAIQAAFGLVAAAAIYPLLRRLTRIK
ncbi:MAG: ECF transporter S component [Oscillospiraceae bacterium]|nr:ECF transporter S component [Oscillospiraceae bacterium]